MLLFPTPYLIPAAAGGLIGFDAPIILKTTATATSFGAGVWTIPVVAGELLTAAVHMIGNSSILDPATFTISVDTVPMVLEGGSVATGTGVFPGSAGFSLIAPTTGTLEVVATVPSPGARACLVVFRRITGYDAADPIGIVTGPSVLNTNTLTLTSGAMSIAAAGNAVVGSAISKAVAATVASSTTLDGAAFDKTGATAGNDFAMGLGHKLLTASGAFSPELTLDAADRMSGVFMEIKKAP